MRQSMQQDERDLLLRNSQLWKQEFLQERQLVGKSRTNPGDAVNESINESDDFAPKNLPSNNSSFSASNNRNTGKSAATATSLTAATESLRPGSPFRSNKAYLNNQFNDPITDHLLDCQRLHERFAVATAQVRRNWQIFLKKKQKQFEESIRRLADRVR
jgi:hypothetical protein